MKSLKSWPIPFALVLLAAAAFGQAPDQGKNAASTSPTQSTPAPGKQAHDNVYVIGNDDHLSIDVWKEPE